MKQIFKEKGTSPACEQFGGAPMIPVPGKPTHEAASDKKPGRPKAKKPGNSL